jgi:hypothetical protein
LARDGSAQNRVKFASFCSANFALTRVVFFAIIVASCRIFMPPRAMRARSHFFARNFSAKSKSGNVSQIFFNDNLVIRKTPSGSIYNGVRFDARKSSQIHRPILHASNIDVTRYPTVSLLIGARSPAAIFRKITAVVIYAIQRVTVRSRPHVVNKSHKIRLPAVANKNSACSVIFPRAAVWISAPIFHRHPNAVKWVRVLKRHNQFLQMEPYHNMFSNGTGVTDYAS